jgi:hypothetical protein
MGALEARWTSRQRTVPVVEVGCMSASGAYEPSSAVLRASLSEVAEVLAAVVVAIEVARNGGDAAFAIEEVTRRTAALHERFARRTDEFTAVTQVG